MRKMLQPLFCRSLKNNKVKHFVMLSWLLLLPFVGLYAQTYKEDSAFYAGQLYKEVKFAYPCVMVPYSLQLFICQKTAVLNIPS